MSKQQYTEVPTDVKGEYQEPDIKSWKPFLRQLFICSGLWTYCISVGICIGTPTVFIPQVRRAANSTDAVSIEMVSWLASIFGYSSIPIVFLLTYLVTCVGRKKTFCFVSVANVVVATGYYLTKTPKHMLITEIIQGVPHACAISISILGLREYTSPKYRGLMLMIKTANVFWATWAANSIGTFTDWKYIAVLSFINAFYSLTVFFWPESPTWLAGQGRFEECRKVHRWLKGISSDSERELEKLIEFEAEIKKNATGKDKRKLGFVVDKPFYMPVFLSSLTMLVNQLSGKQVCTLYALDILKKITKNESTAYTGMLILDGVSVICMYIGAFVSRVLKRRTLLFIFGTLSVLFLFATALYLAHLSILPENSYVSIALLIGFSLSLGLGPIILGTSLYGELISDRYKKESIIVISLVFILIQATLLKIAPQMFKYLDMHGMFFFYGASVTICLILLYKYLPETKGKTLREIEEYFEK